MPFYPSLKTVSVVVYIMSFFLFVQILKHGWLMGKLKRERFVEGAAESKKQKEVLP